ncbi:MAG TPA: hypothetical protein VLK33_19280, partial [Terriglobales bacterium]|nr:hypothetical protein [Terriglobales bacterium]
AEGNPVLYMAWYRWPFNVSPVGGFSYLVGNVVVMLAGLFALGVCAYRIAKNASLPNLLVLSLYLANLLQWAVTPLRVLNYYYYFSAAMFLGPAIAFALHKPVSPKIFGVRLSLLIVILAAVFFLHWYPKMANLQAPWDCMLGCAG